MASFTDPTLWWQFKSCFFFFSFSVSTLSLIFPLLSCVSAGENRWLDEQLVTPKKQILRPNSTFLLICCSEPLTWALSYGLSVLCLTHMLRSGPKQRTMKKRGLSHNLSFSSLQLVLSHLCLWLVNTLGIICCNRSCFVYSDDFYLQPIELFHNDLSPCTVSYCAGYSAEKCPEIFSWIIEVAVKHCVCVLCTVSNQ